ncbi:MAG: endoglucanase [Chloroflexota bacterium]|nr:endoglucanase [Chloroflexota bacterium]
MTTWKRGRAALLAALTAAALCLPVTAVAAGSVGVAGGGNLVQNGDFSDGFNHWFKAGITDDADTSGGDMCIDVDANDPGNPWDRIIGNNDLAVVNGQAYQFSFKAKASSDVTIRSIVGNPNSPYETVYEASPPAALTSTYQSFSYSFTSGYSFDPAQVAFQVGGHAAFTLCLDDVSLFSGVVIPPYAPDTGPRVRVNQVAYLPDGPKQATLVTDLTSLVRWRLLDKNGHTVMRGWSTPRGLNASSGLNVHTIDFSRFHTAGKGYRLRADGETSYAFAISADPYEALRVDSLSFYYPMRSGIAIDGGIAGAAYDRPAGHVSSASGSDTNKGDADVPCQPASVSSTIYGQPWTCDYTRDVTGGWYDAGDHGKYVVNGGITVFQLLDIWERANRAPTGDPSALSDGTLRIPESSNGVPDILDEARWELEWMLKMQVPAGRWLAGMVFHKVHDNEWTGLPLLPDQDPKIRELHRPSTAATLNLAAVAAKGARLFDAYDPAFSAELRHAAQVAWKAAKAHPHKYAPAADGASGGGPYDDADVRDEFYWAASELYLTTGQSRYLDAVQSSPYHLGGSLSTKAFTLGGFDWGHVAALGRMDLASVDSSIPNRDLLQQSVLRAADRYMASQRAEAWGQPLRRSDGTYVWGSNSQVANLMVVIANAFDLSGRHRYRKSVEQGIGYLLGRNALNISWVVGYGDVSSKDLHSRWFAHILNPDLPHPPKGTLAGGPNSMTETWDPVAQDKLEGCAPQFCYIDDIGSWSTNEEAINWNAALSWVASFIADQDDGNT